MRALAEFIMRGRAQAAMVALFGAFVPFVSPSAVALVTLRRGGFDGFYVIAWAMLPVIVMAVVSPETLPMAFYSLCVLVSAIGGALVLRNQAVWPASVMGLVAVSAFGGLIYAMTFPQLNEQLVTELNQAQDEARRQLESGNGEAAGVAITPTLIAGAMAAVVAVQATLALVIGRWWQAMLYNPGGFREEFYNFRLSRTQALICFGIAALCVAQPNWLFWGILAALPLFLQCAAVLHNRVAARNMGLPWLVLFYLLMFFQPFFLLALFIGFTDSWVDFRRRYGPQDPPSGNAPGE